MRKSWRLGRLGCLDSKKNAKKKEKELKKEIDGLSKVVAYEKYIINEHTNDFNKALRQAEFLYREFSTKDTWYDVRKDIFWGHMMDVDEIVIAKAAKKMVMVEDVRVENASNEETDRVSPFVTTDTLNEDEDVVNVDEVVEQ